MAMITVNAATISFDGRNVVENASFTVEKNDYLVMIGENGSGKSTLIRAMLGLVRPASGTVVYGEGLTKGSIGYLPQQTRIQRDFPASVEEVVISGCANRQSAWLPFYGRKTVQRMNEKLDLLGISNLKKRAYRDLSGGQQQRVLLARALCAADTMLFLDEPVTGLDPSATSEMYSLIAKLNREQGVGIVMVTHDLTAGMTDAKYVLKVDKGVDFFGTVSDYKEGIRNEQIS